MLKGTTRIYIFFQSYRQPGIELEIRSECKGPTARDRDAELAAVLVLTAVRQMTRIKVVVGWRCWKEGTGWEAYMAW